MHIFLPKFEFFRGVILPLPPSLPTAGDDRIEVIGGGLGKLFEKHAMRL